MKYFDYSILKYFKNDAVNNLIKGYMKNINTMSHIYFQNLFLFNYERCFCLLICLLVSLFFCELIVLHKVFML